MSTDQIQHIPLSAIIESPDNPRKSYSEASLLELSDTIREHGVQQPIKVRPLSLMGDDSHFTYEVIFGHRRLRSTKLAGLDTIPCIVEEMSDEQADMLRLIENIQREQVSPVEEADAIVRASDKHGISKEEIGKKLGMGRTTVYNKIKLASAHEAVRQKCAEGVIGGEIATHIARLPKAVQQQALQKVITEQPDPSNGPEARKAVALPLDQAKNVLKQRFTIKIIAAAFDPASTSLLPCGACTACDKLSDNEPELLAELGAGTCIDTECFSKKTKAHYQVQIDEARLTGLRVIEGEEARAMQPNTYSYYMHRWTDIADVALESVALNEGDEPADHTYADLIEKAGDQAPQVVLFVSPHDDARIKLHRIIADEDARKLRDQFQPDRGEADEDDDSPTQPPAAPLSPEEQAVADFASWGRIKRAIAHKAAAGKRTTDDLRLVIMSCAELADGVPDTVADVMGWSGDDLPDEYGATMEFIQARTQDMNADQLGALLMAWIIDNAPFTAGHQPDEIRAAKLELAARYGVNVIEAGAEPPPPPPKPEPASELSVPPPVKTKYRNPMTGETWTSRGLQPKWVQAAIASGKRLDDFLTTKPIALTDDNAPDDAGLAEADEQASQEAA